MLGSKLSVESNPGALASVSDFGVDRLLTEPTVYIGAQVKVRLACGPKKYRQVPVQH